MLKGRNIERWATGVVQLAGHPTEEKRQTFTGILLSLSLAKEWTQEFRCLRILRDANTHCLSTSNPYCR
jgi:hypothetical protein